MSLADAALGLAQVVTKTGLRAYDVWPDTVNPPAAIVLLNAADYNVDFNGGLVVHFLIILVPNMASLERSQRELMRYLEPSGEKSIAAGIAADTTLKERAQYARPVGITQYAPQMVAGVDMVCSAIDVEVMI